MPQDAPLRVAQKQRAVAFSVLLVLHCVFGLQVVGALPGLPLHAQFALLLGATGAFSVARLVYASPELDVDAVLLLAHEGQQAAVVIPVEGAGARKCPPLYLNACSGAAAGISPGVQPLVLGAQALAAVELAPAPVQLGVFCPDDPLRGCDRVLQPGGLGFKLLVAGGVAGGVAGAPFYLK